MKVVLLCTHDDVAVYRSALFSPAHRALHDKADRCAWDRKVLFGTIHPALPSIAGRDVGSALGEMDPERADQSRRVFEQFEKRGTWWSLVKVASWSTPDLTAAEDLVSDTLRQVVDKGDPPWDGIRPFKTFMTFAMRHVYADQMRRKSATEAPYDASEIAEIAKARQPSVEEQVDMARNKRDRQAFCEHLREELEREDADLARLFDLIGEEASVEDSAAALRCTVDEVYQKRRTIQRRGLQLKEAWTAERDGAMRVARQRAGVSEEAGR